METAVLEPGTLSIETTDQILEENRYEIVDGEIVETPPMSVDSQGFAFELAMQMSLFGMEHGFGRAYTEILIKLPLPVDRNRRPDAFFVPYEQWSKDRRLPDTNAWAVVPSVCVEVVSPNDLAEEMMTKLQEYFASGVKQVWIAYPRHGVMLVHESPTVVRILTRDDVLEGGTALPGFQLPLAQLFPKLEI